MEYLNRVLTYLKQELPDQYGNMIQLDDNRFIISIRDDVNFITVYDDIYTSISNSISRIRNREIELDFNVKSNHQERDFRILKL